jgi:hypothetical protein
MMEGKEIGAINLRIWRVDERIRGGGAMKSRLRWDETMRVLYLAITISTSPSRRGTVRLTSCG